MQAAARTDLAVGENTAIIGELSLAGEVRPVPRRREQTVSPHETICFTA